MQKNYRSWYISLGIRTEKFINLFMLKKHKIKKADSVVLLKFSVCQSNLIFSKIEHVSG